MASEEATVQSEGNWHDGRIHLAVLVRRLVPVTDGYDGDRFFVRRGGLLMATPLLVVLLTIESTDLVFALDSVPAVFGITTDGFVVFSSNVLAVLGLRSLYFVLSEAVGRLYYLRLGLAAILVFVGMEMVLGRWVEVPVAVSLLVIVVCLGRARLGDPHPPAGGAGVHRAGVRGPPVRDAAEAFGCRRRLRLRLTGPAGPDAPRAAVDDGDAGSLPGRDPRSSVADPLGDAR